MAVRMGSPADNSATLTIGTRRVGVTNLHKPLYPSGFTKGEVADYYIRIAPVLLPYLRGRAITWKRYPGGTGAPFFFEKSCPSYRPDWVRTAEVAHKSGSTNHCVVNDLPTLLWAANLAALELHAPLALAAKPTRPTAIVFDFDPGAPATLLDCLELALRLRIRLQKLGLESFPKTSGGKGLHLYVPLNTPVDFQSTKTFAHAIADALVRDEPMRVTANMSKAHRGGKVFVDWSQNDPQKTTAAPYTLRAGDEPRVSTPITWAEAAATLNAGSTRSLVFSPAAVLRRMEALEDPFSPVLTLKQKLPRI